MEYSNVSTGSAAAHGEFVFCTASSDGTQLPPGKNICHFSCKYCFNLAKEPVVNVICGHIFCWRCIYLKLTSSSESRQGCPFCKSHLDISPSMSTIIPVCSGPEPGFEFCILDYPDEAEQEEADEKHRQALQKRGEEYVPLRPGWDRRSIHASKIFMIVTEMLSFLVLRMDWKHTLDRITSIADIPSGSGGVDSLIKDWKDCWLWLTGEKYKNQPCDVETGSKSKKMKTEDDELDYALVPTEAEFPGVSTFKCKICKKIAHEPVVTVCGHLFCWVCLWNKEEGIFDCPECGTHVSIYISRGDINNIYCKKKNPSKEDDALKSTREDSIKEVIHAPCRINQTVVVPFLHYMITRTTEDVNAIMNMFNVMRLDCANLSDEEIKESVANVKVVWDKLYEDLVRKWRIDTREPVAEYLIEPSFLDEEFVETKTYEDDEKIIYNMTCYVTDIFGDAPEDTETLSDGNQQD